MVVLQKYWRRKLAMTYRKKKLAAVTFLQSMIRRKLAQRLFFELKRQKMLAWAAIVIQKEWRARQARKIFRLVDMMLSHVFAGCTQVPKIVPAALLYQRQNIF